MPDSKGNVDRFVWCDLETFGLDPLMDPILEVAFIITDINLVVIDDHTALVWESPYYDNLYSQLEERAKDDAGAKYVLEMHTTSGLWDAASQRGQTPLDVERDMTEWLSGHGIDRGDPLCGSTVGFDRDMLKSWMPHVIAPFSYRNIDVSSIKESCRRENPIAYAGLDATGSKRELHRGLADLQDTIEEYRYYRENFLRLDHEPN